MKEMAIFIYLITIFELMKINLFRKIRDLRKVKRYRCCEDCAFYKTSNKYQARLRVSGIEWASTEICIVHNERRTKPCKYFAWQIDDIPASDRLEYLIHKLKRKYGFYTIIISMLAIFLSFINLLIIFYF